MTGVYRARARGTANGVSSNRPREFTADFGLDLDDGGYYDAFCGMFEQALNTVIALPEAERQPLIDRLEEVRLSGQGIGWGVEDDLNALWQGVGLKADE